MSPSFQPMVKEQRKLRLALYGPAGGGKTLTTELLCLALAEGDVTKVGIIDSEHGSASVYADVVGQLQQMVLERFGADDYADAVAQAVEAQMLALGIDSFSHSWEGTGGVLDMQTVLTDQNRGDSQTGWNKVKPLEKRLWATVLSAPAHVVVTMRSRNTWVEGVHPTTGKKTREIVGLEPVQRKGSEYEFDIVCFMAPDDSSEIGGVTLKVEKSRYPQLPRGMTFKFDGSDQSQFPDFRDRVLAAVSAGEKPKSATAKQIKALTELLVAEGIEEKRVKDTLDAQTSTYGVVPERFVLDQTANAEQRAKRREAEAAMSQPDQPAVEQPAAEESAPAA